MMNLSNLGVAPSWRIICAFAVAVVVATQAIVAAEIVGVFFDPRVERISFAADDVKAAPIQDGFALEVILHDETAAFDTVQETFAAAVRHIANLRDAAKFASWLFGIAHQKCLQHLRRVRRADALFVTDEGGSWTGSTR